MISDMETKQNKIPCQAVYNKLETLYVSQHTKFASLNKFQTALISPRLLLKEIA